MSALQGKFIILKKTKYGESDLILQALSQEGGRYSFLARGALKSKKRFGGGILEPTHYLLMTYKSTQGENGLNILQEATLVEEFQGLRTDFDKIELALNILECVAKVSMEGDQDSEFLFNLLGHSLKAIEKSPDILITKMHFYLKLLLQQGVVQAEPWMQPFLKTPMNQGELLKPYRQLVDEELSNVEKMVRHYMANAAL